MTMKIYTKTLTKKKRSKKGVESNLLTLLPLLTFPNLLPDRGTQKTEPHKCRPNANCSSHNIPKRQKENEG